VRSPDNKVFLPPHPVLPPDAAAFCTKNSAGFWHAGQNPGGCGKEHREKLDPDLQDV